MVSKKTFPLARARFRPGYGLQVIDTEGRAYQVLAKGTVLAEGIVLLRPEGHDDCPYKVKFDGKMVNGTDDPWVVGFAGLYKSAPSCDEDRWYEVKLTGGFNL